MAYFLQDFLTGNKRMMSFDDLSMKSRQVTDRNIKLCDSPKLNYLNLLDYKDKQGDYHSSILFGPISVLGNRNSSDKIFKNFEEYTSASIFIFYVGQLRYIPESSLNLQVIDQRIHHVLTNLRDESQARYFVCNAIINCIYPRILLPIILKHLCTTEGLITYATKKFFNTCNTRFFKELLDASIKSRFNFWTMWERNFNVNSMPFCPVTYAYFTERFDYLRLLLNYGFYPTRQRVPTLKFLLDESRHRAALCDYWFRQDIQSSRSAVIDEVFLFIGVFLKSFIRPKIAAKCFELAWNARKEPYVTKQELFDSLKNRFPLFLIRNELKLQERFDTFKTLLPHHGGQVAQPRSLQHLCRCTVRESLNDNWQMPHGVAKLPVPDKMKSYILLKQEIN